MARSTFLALLGCKLVAIALACLRLWPEAAFCYFVPDLWVLYHLFVPGAQGLCRNFTRFETDQPEIWLTIDDGPDPQDTPQLLDLLDRHRAKATFFVIGDRAARHPELLAEIVRRGHEVGHHTQTHPVAMFWCASQARVHAELDASLAVLGKSNIQPRWFRPPVGIKNFLLPAALAARHLQCVGWSIRSGDCHSRRPENVVARIMHRLHPGAIVLVHEGPSVPQPVRVNAIALLLEALGAKHYRCILPRPEQLR